MPESRVELDNPSEGVVVLPPPADLPAPPQVVEEPLVVPDLVPALLVEVVVPLHPVERLLVVVREARVVESLLVVAREAAKVVREVVLRLVLRALHPWTADLLVELRPQPAETSPPVVRQPALILLQEVRAELTLEVMALEVKAQLMATAASRIKIPLSSQVLTSASEAISTLTPTSDLKEVFDAYL